MKPRVTDLGKDRHVLRLAPIGGTAPPLKAHFKRPEIISGFFESYFADSGFEFETKKTRRRISLEDNDHANFPIDKV